MKFNINKATQRLKQRFPDRAVCIHVTSWFHESGIRKLQFRASILPGLDGRECNQWVFYSADELTRWIETIEPETANATP